MKPGLTCSRYLRVFLGSRARYAWVGVHPLRAPIVGDIAGRT